MSKRKQKERVQLSQCMIVKNEEKNIRKALSWGKDIVYEQIVVDTGSTDQTIPIAKEMGAKVFSFSWQDDFSAAKNFAIEHASGNWIAFLDADESFSQNDANVLMNILKQVNPHAEIDALRTRLWNLGKEGNVQSIVSQIRVFRNTPNLRYRNRIHENLYRKDHKPLNAYDTNDQLAILHTGYTPETVKEKEKGDRNIHLLLKTLEEDLDNLSQYMYLGDAYLVEGRKEEAWGCYRKVLQRYVQKRKDSSSEESHIVLLHSGLQLMGSRSTELAEEIHEEYFQIADLLEKEGLGDHPDIAFFIGNYYLKEKDITTAGKYFEQSLEKAEQYQGVEVVRMFSNMKIVAFIIALAAEQQNNLPKAVRFAVMALRLDRYSVHALGILLRSFRAEYQDGNLTPYWNMLTQIYKPENLKDMLFLHKIAGECGFFDLQERVLLTIPAEVRDQVDVQHTENEPSTANS